MSRQNQKAERPPYGAPYWAPYDLAAWRGGGSATYATFNPDDSGYVTGELSNGDLTLTGSAWKLVRTTISKEDDEWVVEFTVVNSNNTMIVGVCNGDATLANFIGFDANGYGYYSANGNVLTSAGAAAVYDTWGAQGDKIGVKFNATTMTARWYKNGVAQGESALDISSLGNVPIFIGASCFSGSDVITLNAGATAMTHTYGAANTGLFE